MIYIFTLLIVLFIVKDPSGKKSRESEKLFINEDSSDERRKKLPEHKGFKIPKKVTLLFFQQYYFSTAGCQQSFKQNSLLFAVAFCQEISAISSRYIAEFRRINRVKMY